MTTPIDKVPATKDKPLFTPGPLTTSLSVKQAMLRDLGSRDQVFIATIKRVRDQLLEVASLSADQGYEAVLMQGSGTFGIESVLGSTVPPDGKLLVIINGAYGQRIAKMADVLKIETTKLEYPDNTISDPADVDDILAKDPARGQHRMVARRRPDVDAAGEPGLFPKTPTRLRSSVEKQVSLIGNDARYERWRWKVFFATWLAYGGFYLTRKSFSVAKIDLAHPDVMG